MKYSTQNIFKLANPQEYVCQILFYHQQHSYLLIRIRHLAQKNIHHFEFMGVEYFEGPMGWQGANFCTTTSNEHTNLLRKLKLDVDLYSKNTQLYIVEASSFVVKIVANSVSESEDITKSFPYVYQEP